MIRRLVPHVLVAALGCAALPAMSQGEAMLVEVAPPAAVIEVMPAPREGWVWAPGYYVYRDNAYTWVPGRWETARRGYRYVAPTWTQDNGKWRYTDESWIVDEDKQYGRNSDPATSIR